MPTISAIGVSPCCAQTQQHRLLASLERLGRELLAQLAEILAVGKVAEDLGEAAPCVHAVGDLLAPHVVLQPHA